MPPQTEEKESWWKKLLPAVMPTVLGAGALAVGGGKSSGMGRDIGQAMAGLAAGFADKRSQYGKEKRAQTFKQNEAMLETAHKAVMSLQGKDLKDYPNLSKLIDKYRTAMASQESDGSFISPKEASEIVSLWTVSQGEFGKAQDEAVGRQAAVAGRAEAEGARGREQGFTGASPEAAQATVRDRYNAEQRAKAPVDFNGYQISQEAAAKFYMDKLTQDGIADRMGAQQAAQFAKQMAADEARYKQAMAMQDAQGMRTIFETTLERATTANPLTGKMPFNTVQEAAAYVKQLLGEVGPILTPPQGARGGNVTGVRKIR
jgi:hypothetical protein